MATVLSVVQVTFETATRPKDRFESMPRHSLKTACGARFYPFGAERQLQYVPNK